MLAYSSSNSASRASRFFLFFAFSCCFLFSIDRFGFTTFDHVDANMLFDLMHDLICDLPVEFQVVDEEAVFFAFNRIS